MGFIELVGMAFRRRRHKARPFRFREVIRERIGRIEQLYKQGLLDEVQYMKIRKSLESLIY